VVYVLQALLGEDYDGKVSESANSNDGLLGAARVRDVVPRLARNVDPSVDDLRPLQQEAENLLAAAERLIEASAWDDDRIVLDRVELDIRNIRELYGPDDGGRNDLAIKGSVERLGGNVFKASVLESTPVVDNVDALARAMLAKLEAGDHDSEEDQANGALDALEAVASAIDSANIPHLDPSRPDDVDGDTEYYLLDGESVAHWIVRMLDLLPDGGPLVEAGKVGGAGAAAGVWIGWIVAAASAPSLSDAMTVYPASGLAVGFSVRLLLALIKAYFKRDDTAVPDEGDD
jgi:hypothetical protein